MRVVRRPAGDAQLALALQSHRERARDLHGVTRSVETHAAKDWEHLARVAGLFLAGLGDLKDPRDPIHEFLRTHKVQVLKPQLATGSKT